MNPFLAPAAEAENERAKRSEIYPPATVRTALAASTLADIPHSCGPQGASHVEFGTQQPPKARMACSCGWKSEAIAL